MIIPVSNTQALHVNNRTHVIEFLWGETVFPKHGQPICSPTEYMYISMVIIITIIIIIVIIIIIIIICSIIIIAIMFVYYHEGQ